MANEAMERAIRAVAILIEEHSYNIVHDSTTETVADWAIEEARKLFKEHGLVAIDPTLIAAVRMTKERDCGRFCVGTGDCSPTNYSIAVRRLTDAVLATLDAHPAPMKSLRYRINHTPTPVRDPRTGMLDHFESGPQMMEVSEDDGATWRPATKREIEAYVDDQAGFLSGERRAALIAVAPAEWPPK